MGTPQGLSQLDDHSHLDPFLFFSLFLFFFLLNMVKISIRQLSSYNSENIRLIIITVGTTCAITAWPICVLMWFLVLFLYADIIFLSDISFPILLRHCVFCREYLIEAQLDGFIIKKMPTHPIRILYLLVLGYLVWFWAVLLVHMMVTWTQLFLF